MSIIKRSVMTLFSGPMDPYSHQVRMVLALKGVTVDVISVNLNEPPEDLVDLNPYQSVPTLVDRDLVLYESKVILEYLDERFPHPPLLPVYPVARARCRLMMFRIEQDWYPLLFEIEKSSPGKEADKLRKELKESLLSLAPAFGDMKYFLSEELTLVDCCLAPFLWRLPSIGINLSTSKSIRAYSKRIFSEDSFQASLSDVELELRHAHEL